jgi:DNA-binding XRE family transcriptional regulator
MSVETLADKSGVSERVIEAVESGTVYPALGVAGSAGRALGQRLGPFTDDQFTPDPVCRAGRCRKGGGCSHKANVAEGYCYFPLGIGKSDRRMEPFRLEIAPDTVAPAFVSRGRGIHRGDRRLPSN